MSALLPSFSSSTPLRSSSMLRCTAASPLQLVTVIRTTQLLRAGRGVIITRSRTVPFGSTPFSNECSRALSQAPCLELFVSCEAHVIAVAHVNVRLCHSCLRHCPTRSGFAATDRSR